MAKDKVLFKEVADIFDGYHPLAVFTEGVLYINPCSVEHMPGFEERVEKLHKLVETGPECWELKEVKLGDYTEKKLLQYMGSLELR